MQETEYDRWIHREEWRPVQDPDNSQRAVIQKESNV
jgi:hypothetical protein